MAGVNAEQPHQTGELIVKYRDGVTPAAQAAVRRNLRAQKLQTLRAGDSDTGETTLVKLPAGLSVAAAVRQLSSDPMVEYAEPNWIYQHSDVSNDTYYAHGTLWGMYGDAPQHGRTPRREREGQ